MRKKGQGQGESKLSPKNVIAAERQLKAIELRKAGHTFQEIATRCGYAHPSGAYRAVTLGLKNTLREPCEHLRVLEGERLDGLWRVAWEQAQAGDQAAIARCIDIMKRRASLLGLDAPVKQEIETREHAQVTVYVPDNGRGQVQADG